METAGNTRKPVKLGRRARGYGEEEEETEEVESAAAAGSTVKEA